MLTCVICSGPLTGRQRKTCSEVCRKRHKANVMRDFMRKHRQETGQRYAAKYETKPTAVAAKAERNRRRNAEQPMRARYPEQFAAKDERRRRRLVAGTVGPFSRAEVFERDGWVCYLCGDPVDSTLPNPHPGSATVDHVIPLSRGGEHSMANTRLAHLKCNIAKSDRILSEVS